MSVTVGKLCDRPSGAQQGPGRVLSLEQEDAVRGSIIDQRPEQLKMYFCLWSCRVVMLLIEQQYGIALPVRTMVQVSGALGLYAAKADQEGGRSSAPRQCRLGLMSSTPPMRHRPEHEAFIILGSKLLRVAFAVCKSNAVLDLGRLAPSPA